MKIFKCNSNVKEVVLELKENKIIAFDSTTSVFKNSYEKLKPLLKSSIQKEYVMHPKEGPVYFLYDKIFFSKIEASNLVLDRFISEY